MSAGDPCGEERFLRRWSGGPCWRSGRWLRQKRRRAVFLAVLVFAKRPSWLLSRCFALEVQRRHLRRGRTNGGTRADTRFGMGHVCQVKYNEEDMELTLKFEIWMRRDG
jgi:hypothetical protein